MVKSKQQEKIAKENKKYKPALFKLLLIFENLSTELHTEHKRKQSLQSAVSANSE